MLSRVYDGDITEDKDFLDFYADFYNLTKNYLKTYRYLNTNHVYSKIYVSTKAALSNIPEGFVQITFPEILIILSKLLKDYKNNDFNNTKIYIYYNYRVSHDLRGKFITPIFIIDYEDGHFTQVWTIPFIRMNRIKSLRLQPDIHDSIFIIEKDMYENDFEKFKDFGRKEIFESVMTGGNELEDYVTKVTKKKFI